MSPRTKTANQPIPEQLYTRLREIADTHNWTVNQTLELALALLDITVPSARTPTPTQAAT